MREKGWNIVGRVKNPVPPLPRGPGRIGAGSRVTFVDRFGKNRTGTAVMLGPYGWVLNMGGRHGTPHVVKPESIVKVVNPRRKANPRRKKNLAVSPRHGGWVLVHIKTQTPVTPGEAVMSFRGEAYVVADSIGAPPHHEGSTGRVYVYLEGHDENAMESSYYPSVFDMKWIKSGSRGKNPSKKAALMRRAGNPVHKASLMDDPSEVFAAMKLEYTVLKRKVSSKIPVSGIERMVDARPASTSFRDIEKAIRDGTAGPGWTDKMVKEAVAIAIARHRVRQAAEAVG